MAENSCPSYLDQMFGSPTTTAEGAYSDSNSPIMTYEESVTPGIMSDYDGVPLSPYAQAAGLIQSGQEQFHCVSPSLLQRPADSTENTDSAIVAGTPSPALATINEAGDLGCAPISLPTPPRQKRKSAASAKGSRQRKTRTRGDRPCDLKYVINTSKGESCY
jgi:hypothetical protein